MTHLFKTVPLLLFLLSTPIFSQKTMNPLTDFERFVIEKKGTEKPFTGEYNNFQKKGIYVCKKCDAALYFSSDKFSSNCGWPSFDAEISDAVTRVPDADGLRTEIQCTNCSAHLGHVFVGEQITAKNTRHCVNSVSLQFIPESDLDTAYFSSGCFWGTQYYLRRSKGVLYTAVGYAGGKTKQPSYKEVCTGNTGHAETTKVIFNTKKTDYTTVTKLFFETHNFTEIDRQGPDIGTQYRSLIFYTNKAQETIANTLKNTLIKKGYPVATAIEKLVIFWPAELYHQNYYERNGKTPYCHKYTPVF